MAPTKNNRRGVTFLEIVFAVAILACAMIPIITMSQQSIKRAGFNIHRVTATMLSNQLMERYRTMPFTWLEKQFGDGNVDLTGNLSSDPILASPALPKSYKELLKKYTVTGSFEDVSGDQTLGLLSFTVQWMADRKTKRKSKLSLGKAVINYEKFGIKTVNTQGGFLQTGGATISSLNTDWNAPPPTNPSSTGPTTPTVPTDTNTGASPTTAIPPNPFGAINNYG